MGCCSKLSQLIQIVVTFKNIRFSDTHKNDVFIHNIIARERYVQVLTAVFAETDNVDVVLITQVLIF